jgi:ASC-1-like (ASCH) protein
MNIKDIPSGLVSSVRDILNQNQNLYQQDLEKRYGIIPKQEYDKNSEPVDPVDEQGSGDE